MLIVWKALWGFGFTFWMSMVLTEYLFGKIIHHGEFDKHADEDIDADDEIPLITRLERIDKFLNIREDPDWYQILTWTTVSFIATIILCLLLQLVKILISKCKTKYAVTAESKEELVEPSASYQQTDTTTGAMKTIAEEIAQDLLQVEKKSSRIPKRQKTSDDNNSMDVNTATWKEYTILVKKYDTVVMEKKNVLYKNGLLFKENEYLKKQLNDILNDRTMLLKRLECATKEIKQNTFNKQMTLQKLEAAMTCSNQMKQTIQDLSSEKSDLELKVKQLEFRMLNTVKNQSVKKAVEEEANNDELGQKIILNQTDGDIEKVQSRLKDLEISLQNIRNTKSQIMEKSDNSDDSIESEQNVDVEESVDMGFVNDEDTTDYDEVDEPPEPIINENTEETKLAPTNSSSAADSNISSEYASDATTLNSEVESESELFNNGGIVSKSPAFQKFLLKVLETPPGGPENEIVV